MNSASHDPSVPASQLLSGWGRAIAAGAAAAILASTNFVQPLTPVIASDMQVPVDRLGAIGAATQFGYACGALAIVPLGDVVDRRRIALVLLLAGVGGLACMALSPSIAALMGASVLIGVATSVCYVLVPFIASCAPKASRARFVAQVMVGMLLSTPLAWIGAGWIGHEFGWRAAYVADGLLIAILMLPVARLLPADRTRQGDVRDWPRLMASLPGLIAGFAQLRERLAYSFLNVAAFILFWTGLPIFLAGPSHTLDAGQIGLFGLVAVPGAMLAPLIGRAVDRGFTGMLTVGLPVVAAMGWLALLLARDHVYALAGAALLVSSPLMGMQVLNQAVVSAINADAQSRMTAIYMFAGLVGAACGAGSAGAILATSDWSLLCTLGASLAFSIVVIRIGTLLAGRHAPPPTSSNLRHEVISGGPRSHP